MKSTRVLMLAFLGLYAGACATPALRNGGDGESANYIYGWTLLMMGWLPPYIFAWMANPLMLAGWGAYLFRCYRTARVIGLVAFIFALTTWYLLEPASLFIGYFLWQASAAALTACAYLAAEGVRKTKPATADLDAVDSLPIGPEEDPASPSQTLTFATGAGDLEG
ncbi:hypothetical protein [Paludisphaera mucosa]|uniref:Uncharacterized protein n=1 Tax=Paludisphaera mucosa TaxID=3030827 RepID=A0ABT6FIF0_9BACT|nr:hypothetical protein [Paludisphaera mucosa]MDG3007368.1 hypothetical protein [Paludisphaera mucosa]